MFAVAQLDAQRGDELATLRVDRAHAAEQLVVRADLGESLGGDAATPRDVLEERHDVIGSLRATEGHHQKRVVRGLCGHDWQLGQNQVERPPISTL